MNFIKRELKNSRDFPALAKALQKKGLRLAEGVCEGAFAPLVSALCENERGALVLCESEREALKVASALSAYGEKALFFPAREYSLTAEQTKNEVFGVARLSVLAALCSEEKALVVTTAEAALQTTLTPEKFSSLFCRIRRGETLSPEELTARLLRHGFSRADRVEGVGQFSVRGGIVDFFSPSEEEACRVEFFGDEIDSIRAFDTQSQKSTHTVEEVTLLPAEEIYLSADERQFCKEQIEEKLAAPRLAAPLREFLEAQKSALEDGFSPAQDPLFAALDDCGTLFDHVADFPVFVSSLSRTGEGLLAARRAQSALFEAAADAGAFALATPQTLPDEEAFFALLRTRRTLAVSSLSSGFEAELFEFSTRPSPLFADNREVLFTSLGDLVRAECRVYYLAATAYAAVHLTESLQQEGFRAFHADPETYEAKSGEIVVFFSEEVAKSKGRITGFECPAAHFCLLCETQGADDVPAHLRRRKAHRERSTKEALRSYADLTVGDYVVHEAYGIAVFEGIQTITQNGALRDFLKLRYAGSDVLYVPCSNLSQVSKYIGRTSDGTLALSHMGTSRWNEHKRRAKNTARDIAKDLIRLYSEREKTPGYAFSADTPWQAQFEESFEYEETAGQLLATEEVKRDMESSRPMDRLLCGDVGFGKTEVALRAVFKCVMDSRQAAILAPTTLLCQQHLRTVLSRFRGYPVRVEMLSRFSTKKQISKTLAALRDGSCDIVIGTHRLLQKDVSFLRLGLLVVDEEQRFGVSHKEKLKELAKNVDVLTLTATPIPRTLNMALSGVRDLSLLEEAPGDRLPVQTVVTPFDDALILGAIKKELSRRGQVFYLVNDIARLPHRAAWIQENLPEARVRFAHGKLEREELWSLWQEMSEGEVDVLVCTTIVETGIDLANANTLIVEHAERFGLSQLHQLRGRVGRSWRRAYAYFTYPAMRALPELAEKRLEAIREFAKFGSGFNLAMRDLELRGAGNLLGAQQSGHMEKIGYDLYMRILSDAVLEERGITPQKTADCYIDLPIRARLTESYVPSSADRIALYQRFSALLTEAAETPLREELKDRFGPLPAEAENLFTVARLRREALAFGIEKVTLTENVLSFFQPETDEALCSLLSAVYGRYFYVSSGEKKKLNLRLVDRDAIEAVEDFFFHYRAFSHDLYPDKF
ncbi:MAG: transcription-repair coupling factor [Clostridia bacterium]|nr:transcription-repair coupling factor [Clostridia bacterium]